MMQSLYTPLSLYEMFDERRKALGLKQEDVGMRITGRPDSSVLQNMKRGAMPSIKRVNELCQALELECYVGPKRRTNRR